MTRLALPLLFLGAGRMGAAIASGLVEASEITARDLILIDPKPGEEALALAAQGARLNPDSDALGAAGTVILAVKPQMWREAAATYAPHLSPTAHIVSIAAGVRTADLCAAFAPRAVVRVMPTTAVAVAKGVASLWSPSAEALETGRALFAPLAAVVDLDTEDLMDAATAVSGSGPAYLYALVEAMEEAGLSSGLSAEGAAKLARATVIGAAALMEKSPASPAELRRQVTSPGGTTEAALKVLQGEGGLPALMQKAVAAAIARAKELG
jgi:pyrroline-5-carboxylate reductase